MLGKRIVVIGGGVAGYPGAIRAARLGAEVTLVEKHRLGGTCLNWGCIPTKTLLHATELCEQITRGGELVGLCNCENIRVELPVLLKRKKAVVEKLAAGVKALLKAKNIKLVTGTACFENEKELRILDTGEKIVFDAALIATGSKVSNPPIPGTDCEGVITSKEALDIDKVPESLAIIGGGIIGVEFAQIFERLGSKVIILEMMDRLLGNEDRELAAILRQQLEEDGVEVKTCVKVTALTRESNTKRLKVHYLEQNGVEEKIAEAEKVLIATGRVPNIEELGLDRIGIELEKKAIKVNKYLETNCKGVYAAGDCICGPMLAHSATAQAEIAVKNSIMGRSLDTDRFNVPRCIYTRPQIAACGLTEEQAEAITDIRVARFPLSANGKASLINESFGLIKIIADRKLDQVMGVMMAGASATELIGIACLGMNLEATTEELAGTIFAHPTISEIFRECAMQFDEGAIHLP